jgi:hypothetical protein
VPCKDVKLTFVGCDVTHSGVTAASVRFGVGLSDNIWAFVGGSDGISLVVSVAFTGCDVSFFEFTGAFIGCGVRGFAVVVGCSVGFLSVLAAVVGVDDGILFSCGVSFLELTGAFDGAIDVIFEFIQGAADETRP